MMRKTWSGVVFCGLLGLGGCNENLYDKDLESKTETIEGIPISVGADYAQYHGTVSTVLEREGKSILARGHYWNTEKSALAQALIQSEINDGDNEKISLVGEYHGDVFRFDSISANGYKLNSKGAFRE